MNCPYCGKEIQPDCKTCPYCLKVLTVLEKGYSLAPTHPGNKNARIILCLVLAVVVFIICARTYQLSQQKSGIWTYKWEESGGAQDQVACTRSTNTFDLRGSPQRVELRVWQQHDGSHIVQLKLDGGEGLRLSLDKNDRWVSQSPKQRGTTLVRFDGGVPEEFALTAYGREEFQGIVIPARHEDDAFFDDPEAFFNRLYQSKKVYIQTETEDAGAPVMEFNVDGLRFQKTFMGFTY